MINFKQILKQDNNWASKLVARLVKEIGINPLLVEIEINNIIAPQIYAYLKENKIYLYLYCNIVTQ